VLESVGHRLALQDTFLKNNSSPPFNITSLISSLVHANPNGSIAAQLDTHTVPSLETSSNLPCALFVMFFLSLFDWTKKRRSTFGSNIFSPFFLIFSPCSFKRTECDGICIFTVMENSSHVTIIVASPFPYVLDLIVFSLPFLHCLANCVAFDCWCWRWLLALAN
jgi:hypothetical protein